MNVAIPTISAEVSLNSSANNEDNEILKLVQRKFKQDEKVIAVFESSEILKDGRVPRILALVESNTGGTYGLFSMESLKYFPPRHTNDLAIKQVFPMDSSFKIQQRPDHVSPMHFEFSCSDVNPTVFYYDNDETFINFQAKIQAALTTVDLEKLNLANTAGPLNFDWINDYRNLEMNQELKRLEHEYIVYKEFSIYCATWNVNNKVNYSGQLPNWLTAYEKPDIYAIALQELDTSALATAFNEERCDMLWIKRIFNNIPTPDEYEELQSVRLVGMMLTIIVRKDIRAHANISRCQIKSIPRGVFKTIESLKPLGNKGGIAVSFQLNEDKICFVNSHLAPHLKAVKDRNDDYSYIARTLMFDDGTKLDDHDHIFWIGDLNYRIDEPFGISLPFDNYDLEAYQFLLKYDQLKKEMQNQNCFRGYQEGIIEFRPTYKYDTGTDNYDSSEKQRLPAYCDRVLWKGSRIKQLVYNSIMEIRESDHKPVYAIFVVNIKTKDEIKYKRVHYDLIKRVDKHENENQPQLIIEENTIDFGSVRFNDRAVRYIKVSNISPIKVQFEFKEKDNSSRPCEKWLTLEPNKDILRTDSCRSISVKLRIGRRTIQEFLQKFSTSGDSFCFDILILKVVGGRHIFITITGTYEPSCFGLDIETLCRTDRPLSKYSQSEFKQLILDKSEKFRATMPREIYMLIDHLFKLGAKARGLFSEFKSHLSNNIEFAVVRDWLDTWSEDEFPETAQAAAEALMMLLSLPQKPLLYPYAEELVNMSSDAAMECISKLSSPKRNVFVHLCLFLRDGIEKDFYNLRDVANLFGPILLRCKKNELSQQFMLRILSSDMGAVSLATTQIGNDTPSANQANSSNTTCVNLLD